MSHSKHDYEELNRITGAIIGAAIEVHRFCGNGLLESAYEMCLCYELTLRGFYCKRQVECPINYKGLFVETAYRMDVVVNDLVVVELKTVEKLAAGHEAQLLTYLKFSDRPLGLLLNFREARLKDGIQRVINDPLDPR